MRGYGQFCPVAIASEIFAERWTPLVVRELFCGSHRFNELVIGLPRIPRSVLVQRLRTLESSGVVERRVDTSGRNVEYHLTPAGIELGEVVVRLGDWGQRWADVPVGPKNLDPDLLIWDIHRRLDNERLPEQRVVVQIDLGGAHTKSYWLILERPEASVCWTDPGFEPDLLVEADSVALHRVWVGQLGLEQAMREGLIEIHGPDDLRRAFPGLLKLSLFVERQAMREPPGLPAYSPS
ncbi:MAG: transcriptional regulator, HxlR family [Thermomicrobiales bacterium]|jgi:DNA-binding HxlR family transcriptional regulator|nr:transcriptional regulator, HxlR family [Thermomicrobiales bacterium]